ncbi:MAG TPA: Ni/Fe hydrogenase subunit alpha [Vicinamibacteria bacterium]|nr:Ni/Fe hydrogenase subunit alpha [Vicinamibacteria bacterium]
MARRIVIDPVTRIEGHAKITLHLNDAGDVADARFHVTEFRGFEKFCEGRPFREMPAITSRICGICPVSHLLASAKAGDALLAVEIPEPAVLLRRLMNLGQLVQSHALSFFHLSSPDLLLGFDAEPQKRNILGLLDAHPDVARHGIRLRQLGQEIVETLGGRRIHPTWAIAGGVDRPLAEEDRDRLRRSLPEGLAIVRHTIDWFKRAMESHREEAQSFGNFPSLFLGLVGPDGSLDHYDGRIRIVDAGGAVLQDQVDPARYEDVIGETAEPWSYLKFPYYKPLGYPAGMYRVGPLARLNVASRCGTPEADQELAEFRDLGRGAVLSSFHYHRARLIEVLFALEKAAQILDEPEITSLDVMAHARRNRLEGVGAIEAPRGVLFHHYRVRPGGLLTWVNLLIATGQNNLAMNQAILQIARRYVQADRLSEGMLNRVEAGIRAFDPCLSCSTHAVGEMPMRVQLVAADGTVLDEQVRG